MADLLPKDFKVFFEAVHGHEPFPWQQSLLDRVASEGRWPSLLDLPTGSGKTAALDIAVFAQALEAHADPTARRCPRRTILVVDRRTVVDQGYVRAKRIRTSLSKATDGVLLEVARRLRHLSGADNERVPLGVHVLRGGIPRDETWTENPAQALIAVSTVDQVGSRLLFRGYGVSRGMRPLQAGLLGNDVLFLLDEVHLAGAFRDTLKALEDRYRNFEARGLPDRWQVVQMSATPGVRLASTFNLEERDRTHPELSKRLGARKPATLAQVNKPGRAALATEMATVAAELAVGACAMGIVVNRVETARQIHETLQKLLARQSVSLMLVTGRMRPFDRADLERQLVVEFGSDRDRVQAATRILVSTQCIEAGADFDFDVLLTECASLDALRQRFGRLDRMGQCHGARGIVFVREADLKGTDDDQGDPIYGHALRNTWEYLKSLDSVDFGIEAFVQPSTGQLQTMIAASKQAPVLLPAHLDAWVQTTPEPYADPEPALWLHGQQPADLDVSLIWRADIDEQTLSVAANEAARSDNLPADGEGILEQLKQRLEVCPPRSMEAMQLPLGVVRSWLKGQKAGAISDAGALEEEVDEREAERPRPALIWRGEETWVWSPDLPRADRRRLRPGDTVIVPSEYGGLRGNNWDPGAPGVVEDLGDRAQFEQRGQAVLRLHPRVLGNCISLADDATPSGPVPRQSNPDDEAADDHQLVRDYLPTVAAQLAPKHWLHRIVEVLSTEYQDAAVGETWRKARTPRLVAVASLPGDDERSSANTIQSLHGRPWFTVRGRRRYRTTDDEGFIDLSAESEQSSMTGYKVSLYEHLGGVGDFARQFANQLGLSPALVRVVELAGRWHDAGKADPRFQQWLQGGSAFKALRAREKGELLAKSAFPAQDRVARERARERAGYPKGGRHELLSLALMENMPNPLEPQLDWELVLYLVASHHGHCRPFAPYVEDEKPCKVQVTIDGVSVSASTAHGLERFNSGVADRFWTLVRRYGWHGLAWLEAVLRLADHRRSQAEAEVHQLQSTEQEHAA